MILEDWFTIPEAYIMPNPVVALSNVLEVTIYLAYLAFYFQSPCLLKGPTRVNDQHKKTIEERTLRADNNRSLLIGLALFSSKP